MATSRMYYVYILGSASGTLYIGVTRDLEKRLFEHRSDLVPGFTKRYRIHRLMYYEATENVGAAIAREKQLKGWRRDRKLELIKSKNPGLDDLSREWR